MPIYAYKCGSCGHAKDVLQKMSDPLLTVCPACGEAAFSKQVTAAGFQLKGSGWYVTDFRDGSAAKGKEKTGDKAGDGAKDAKAAPGGEAAPTGAASDAPSASPASPGPVAAPAPAAAPTPVKGD